MARHQPTVAFDFSGLDHLNAGNGQYRYCTELLHGLAMVADGWRVVVAGSRPRPADEIAHLFDGDGWSYAHMPQHQRKGAFYLDQLRYARFLRRVRADLFHSPHTFVPRWPVPAVVTVLDLMMEMFPEYRAVLETRPYKRFKSAVQQPRTHAIAISKTTAGDLQKYWRIPAERISTVWLGFDEVTPAVSVGDRLRDLARDQYILAPFNLEPRKNLEALLVAFAGLRDSFSTVRLVLFGRAAVTDERERHFRARVDALNLADGIALTGVVSDAELAWLYRSAAMFVFPSLYEGFGIPVLEAMHAGTCVVARNQSAMAEVLGDAGVQVDTADAAALKNAIHGLFVDPARRATLGAAGRLRAATFTRDAMARGTLDVYRRVIAR
jgi:glycosyltransferase involved in cell wall biosynthesis